MQKSAPKQLHVHRSGTAGLRCTDTSPARHEDPNGSFFSLFIFLSFSFLFISFISELSFHFRLERPRGGAAGAAVCSSSSAAPRSPDLEPQMQFFFQK